MTTVTVRITHGDKVITTFERETFDYPEYDVPWHEVPVLSDKWHDTNNRIRISPERSTRGAPKGMLDKQASAPHYLGLPYSQRSDGSAVKWLDAPSQWSWGDGKAGFSMPRDGDRLPGSDTVFRIKYEFPDGGQPIWHHNVAPALDLLAEQGIDEVPVPLLRRVVNEWNRRAPNPE